MRNFLVIVFCALFTLTTTFAQCPVPCPTLVQESNTGVQLTDSAPVVLFTAPADGKFTVSLALSYPARPAETRGGSACPYTLVSQLTYINELGMHTINNVVGSFITFQSSLTSRDDLDYVDIVSTAPRHHLLNGTSVAYSIAIVPGRGSNGLCPTVPSIPWQAGIQVMQTT